MTIFLCKTDVLYYNIILSKVNVFCSILLLPNIGVDEKSKYFYYTGCVTQFVYE